MQTRRSKLPPNQPCIRLGDDAASQPSRTPTLQFLVARQAPTAIKNTASRCRWIVRTHKRQNKKHHHHIPDWNTPPPTARRCAVLFHPPPPKKKKVGAHALPMFRSIPTRNTHGRRLGRSMNTDQVARNDIRIFHKVLRPVVVFEARQAQQGGTLLKGDQEGGALHVPPTTGKAEA